MFKPENLKKWILQDREKNHSQIDEEPQFLTHGEAQT
jgi:hypothetical protein